MKNFLVGACVALAAHSSLVSAEEDSSNKTGSGPNAYVDCGIGAALFPDTHWAAVTSNVTWDLGLTALTSATASPETCQSKKVVMADYIKGTYASLEADLMSGDGEWANGLATVSQCSGHQSQAFIEEVRTGLVEQYADKAFTQRSDFEKGYVLYLIADHSAQQCQG